MSNANTKLTRDLRVDGNSLSLYNKDFLGRHTSTSFSYLTENTSHKTSLLGTIYSKVHNDVFANY